MKSIHLSRAALEPWAILPQQMTVLVEIVTRHFAGEKLSAEEVQTRIHGARRPSERSAGAVAVLPLFGTIFPRANLMTDVSGATSAEIFGKRFDELVNDATVGAIVLDIDSPGGQVSGVEELSKKIYDARGSKPIVAVANHTMASAAYWIGTAADEVVATPSAEVGSIGVFALHEDVSAALEKDGVKISLISEGKFKTEGNPYEPLNEESRAAIQARVAEHYDAFVRAVARNRGVKVSDVRGGFGEGRVVGARQAVSLGMADRVGTLDETIARLQRGKQSAVSGQRSAASQEQDETDFRRRRMRLNENGTRD
jgi:signal peptide peptidase SppA